MLPAFSDVARSTTDKYRSLKRKYRAVRSDAIKIEEALLQAKKKYKHLRHHTNFLVNALAKMEEDVLSEATDDMEGFDSDAESNHDVVYDYRNTFFIANAPKPKRNNATNSQAQLDDADNGLPDETRGYCHSCHKSRDASQVLMPACDKFHSTHSWCARCMQNRLGLNIDECKQDPSKFECPVCNDSCPCGECCKRRQKAKDRALASSPVQHDEEETEEEDMTKHVVKSAKKKDKKSSSSKKKSNEKEKEKDKEKVKVKKEKERDGSDVETTSTKKKKRSSESKKSKSKSSKKKVSRKYRKKKKKKPTKKPAGPVSESLLGHAKTLLDAARGHKMCWPFHEPVDPIGLGIPDYFEVIKRPMDFSTIRDRLKGGRYSRSMEALEEFVNDVRLVFLNALTYNDPASEVHSFAIRVNNFFEKRLAKTKLPAPIPIRQIVTVWGDPVPLRRTEKTEVIFDRYEEDEPYSISREDLVRLARKGGKAPPPPPLETVKPEPVSFSAVSMLDSSFATPHGGSMSSPNRDSANPSPIPMASLSPFV
eukprot:GILJ01006097.1.p1 GENE.GILJ01006097.1~~GILJ01006097.1.p1  ORF type:complete len:537 (-),score=91.50 GILJ01006097.1:91-1701(-)